MTADWKKSPLERAKRRDDLKALQAKVKELEEKLGAAQADKRWLQSLYEQARETVSELRPGNYNYGLLRARGVLLEDGGEFKHLQDEDLDKFLEPQGPNRVINSGFTSIEVFNSQVLVSERLTLNIPHQYTWQPHQKQK